MVKCNDNFMGFHTFTCDINDTNLPTATTNAVNGRFASQGDLLIKIDNSNETVEIDIFSETNGWVKVA